MAAETTTAAATAAAATAEEPKELASGRDKNEMNRTMLQEAASVFHASDGAAYERWLGRWSSRLAEAFLDFVDFPDDGELLDVGCGTGSLAMAMARRWPSRRVIGVDLSEHYVSYAQSRRTGTQPTFETGDACALTYRDGRFAGVAAQLLFLNREL